MNKLRLDLEDLAVESFDTTPATRAENGTVFGQQCTCYTQCTCPGCPTCDASCNGTCVGTCAASCNGTCGDYSCAGTCGNLDTCGGSYCWTAYYDMSCGGAGKNTCYC